MWCTDIDAGKAPKPGITAHNHILSGMSAREMVSNTGKMCNMPDDVRVEEKVKEEQVEVGAICHCTENGQESPGRESS